MKSLKNYLVAGLIGLGSFNFIFAQPNLNKLQYEKDIRYSDSRIPYKIGYCSQQNKAIIKKAFGLLEEKTMLKFYEVNTGEKILFTFENIDKTRSGSYAGNTKIGSFRLQTI